MKAYSELKAAGLCARCGKRNALPGRIFCAKCAGYHHGVMKRQRERRLAQGLCVRCGKQKARPGRTLCQDCAGRHNSTVKHSYEKRRLGHACARCGAQLPADDQHKNCAACREQARLRMAAKSGRRSGYGQPADI